MAAVSWVKYGRHAEHSLGQNEQAYATVYLRLTLLWIQIFAASIALAQSPCLIEGQKRYDSAVDQFKQGVFDTGAIALDSALAVLAQCNDDEAKYLFIAAYNDKVKAAEYQGANMLESLNGYQYIVDNFVPGLDRISAAHAKTYFNLGNTYYQLGLIGNAEYYLKKADAAMAEVSPDNLSRRAYIYGSLANLMDVIGKHQIAIQYGQQALDFLEQQYGIDGERSLKTRGNMMMRYIETNQHQAAASSYARLQTIKTKLQSSDIVNYPVLLDFEASWLIYKGEHRAALEKLELIEQQYPDYLKIEDGHMRILKEKVDVLLLLEHYTSAHNILRDALQDKSKLTSRHLIYSLVCDLHLAMDAPHKALKASEELMLFVFGKPKPSQDYFSSAYGTNAKMLSLATYIRCQYAVAQSTGNPQDWENLLHAVTNAQHMYEREANRSNPGDLFVLREQGWYRVYEFGAEAAYNLYSNSRNEKYLEAAWFLFESARSAALMSSVNRLNSEMGDFVPSELVAEEKSLKNSLAFGLQQINSEDQDPNQRLEIIRIQEKLDDLVALYKTQYPEYARQRFNPAPYTLNQVRDLSMNSDISILSYLTGSEKSFGIVVDSGRIQISELPNEQSIANAVLDWRNLGSRRPEISSFSKATEELDLTSFKLYDMLISPFYGQKALPRNLLILPHGPLHHLPFEALQNSYQQDYVISSTNISYGYSLTLMKSTGKTAYNHTVHKILAMAPNFKTSEVFEPGKQKWNSLPGAAREVQSMASLFKDLTIRNEAENYNWFMENAHNYDVIHFATHAFASNDDAFASGLLLDGGAEAGQRGVLRVSDLYYMTLNTELIVLSACETGDGIFKQGEGMVSLAHGFAHAGSQTIVMSLWQANDASTDKVIGEFYKELSQGQSISAALAEAKRRYLIGADPVLKHPFYWSNLVLIGKDKTLELGANTSLNSNYFAHPLARAGGFMALMVLGGFLAFQIYRRLA